jgi:Flp pilus assembly pilin Flp
VRPYPSQKFQGQALLEYSLILVLVGVVVILVLKIFGPQIGGIFSKINSSLGMEGTVAAEVPAPTATPDAGPGYDSVAGAQAAYCAANPSGHGNTYWNPTTNKYIDVDWGTYPPAGFSNFVVHQHCS